MNYKKLKYKWHHFFEVDLKYGRGITNLFDMALQKICGWLTFLFRPYNVVRIETLERGWCDRDGIMLHAMMQIVVDFVEKEWGGAKKKLLSIKETEKDFFIDVNKEWWADAYLSEVQQNLYDLKVIRLYLKWKWILKQGPLYEIPVEEEDQMLRDVLEVRRGMWT